jgi:hypothetical protein
MKLTNNAQKSDAINEAYTQRMEAREHYAVLAARAGDEEARDDILRIDRELEKLRAEALKLKAEG